MNNIKIGITIGDVNGIGPEVIIKALLDNRILTNITPIIYGSSKVMSYHKKVIDAQEFNPFKINTPEEAKKGKINIINCWEEDVKIDLGQSTEEGGAFAFKSLEAATKDLGSNKLDAIVTAPINKHNIKSKDFNFPGHTEYLTKLSNESESVMLMVSERLRVGVVSGHESLAEVVKSITKEKILKKLRIINASLIKDFRLRSPRIAVLGLNPHAGEKGLMGTEEIDIITPAIETANHEGILAFGPYPSDGFFGSENLGKFDAILAMYHDQGLTPFKALSFGTGVNYTAGLPIVRTSPDHGTGYDLAGKNQANESSFRHALYLAHDIVINRHHHKEINQNPLQVKEILEKER
jgi:4-hydroxythreonine-4-phosphate dehydrogenase